MTGSRTNPAAQTMAILHRAGDGLKRTCTNTSRGKSSTCGMGRQVQIQRGRVVASQPLLRMSIPQPIRDRDYNKY